MSLGGLMMYNKEDLINDIKKLLSSQLSIGDKVDTINDLREAIHEYSPFKEEPVDYVKWVIGSNIVANSYNPNKVAPPEMKLLEISILADGYTQPIVTFPHDNVVEVIDGFHRNRVGKESEDVRKRIHGYLPTVIIKTDRHEKNDRIASTIRHNRARGKHTIDAMSEIVLELKNRNWKNERIAKELGMDEEEILRLCQISGLEDIFKDDDFSKSWNVEDSEIDNFESLTDEVTEQEKQENLFRTINTSDEQRVFHTYDKWECYKNNFYGTTPLDGMTAKQCEEKYAAFLSDDDAFRKALHGVITEWKHSCEHYLTNVAMNRIAWLGQAALAYALKIPSRFCGGFYLLSQEQQDKANQTAFQYLNEWLKNNSFPSVTFEEAYSVGRQVEIY
jgi:ParB-like chromosome segregation protein Spo0J